MLTFQFTGVDGAMTEEELLTSGMVGKEVTLVFDSTWSGMHRTAVFVAGGVCRTAEVSGDTVAIPADVLLHPCNRLYVGVYGYNDAGDIVTPTIMVKGPRVEYGADPAADSVTPDQPIWRSLQEQIGQLENLNTAAKDSLVSAINEVLAQGGSGTGGTGRDGEDGATFTPFVNQRGDLSWTNDKGLPNPATVTIMGPAGKSAYAYAREGGYTGTEAQFAAKLAENSTGSLPAVTTADNGKVLAVVNGAWAVSDGALLPDAEEAGF